MKTSRSKKTALEYIEIDDKAHVFSVRIPVDWSRERMLGANWDEFRKNLIDAAVKEIKQAMNEAEVMVLGRQA